VRPHPIEIRIEGPNQQLESSFKGDVCKRDPLDAGKRRQGLMANWTINDRDQPLVVGLGVGKLIPAYGGLTRIRADDEYEIVGLFDMGAFLLPPFRRWRYVLEVNSHVPSAGDQAVP
jgi:hypothetical protein